MHISGIGVDAASASTYVRARAIGERLVREQFPQATILRPSVLFGPDDAFLNRLAAMARLMPVLPLFGSGETRLQPVYVGDVAEAVAKVLTMPSAKGQVYELGGPRIYTYKALVQLVLTQIDRQRPLLPVPFFVWELLASLMAPLPKHPISRDQVILMKQDNVVDPQAATFADLGIAPTSIEEILPTYLGRHPDEPGPERRCGKSCPAAIVLGDHTRHLRRPHRRTWAQPLATPYQHSVRQRRGQATGVTPSHHRGENDGHGHSDRHGSCPFGPPLGVQGASRGACSQGSRAARKREILERWRHDALELQTADDEAMSGGEAPMMQRVNDALLELERQTGIGAPHKRASQPEERRNRGGSGAAM